MNTPASVLLTLGSLLAITLFAAVLWLIFRFTKSRWLMAVGCLLPFVAVAGIYVGLRVIAQSEEATVTAKHERIERVPRGLEPNLIHHLFVESSLPNDKVVNTEVNSASYDALRVGQKTEMKVISAGPLLMAWPANATLPVMMSERLENLARVLFEICLPVFVLLAGLKIVMPEQLRRLGIGWVHVIVAGVLTVAFGYPMANFASARMYSHAEATIEQIDHYDTATVLDLLHSGTDGTHYETVKLVVPYDELRLRFAPAEGAETVLAADRIDGGQFLPKVGGSVEVIFDRQNPRHARVVAKERSYARRNAFAYYTSTGLKMVAAGLVLVVGVVVFFYLMVRAGKNRAARKAQM